MLLRFFYGTPVSLTHPKAQSKIPLRAFGMSYLKACPNEEPRRKQRGIFVGAEIYFTGGVHTSFVLLHNSHSQKKATAGFYRGV
jgi:hypothetical protein